MLKKDHKDRVGNDKFYGFAIDLMERVAKDLDFEYEMYVVPDGNFGVELPTGEWNGLVGEVLCGVNLFLSLLQSDIEYLLHFSVLAK